jgi:hypothetical protein
MEFAFFFPEFWIVDIGGCSYINLKIKRSKNQKIFLNFLILKYFDSECIAIIVIDVN